MRKSHSSIHFPQKVAGIERFLSIHLFVMFFLLAALPLIPVVMANDATNSEAVTPQADETPAPTPTPSEEELKLQQQKRLLELQRDIEQARKAIRDAQPQPEKPAAPTATPLSGDTTLTDVKLEPEIVSYKAMSEAAKIISTEVKTSIDNELASEKQYFDDKINKERSVEKKEKLQAERLRLDI